MNIISFIELQEMSKNVQLKWVDNTIKNAEE